MASSSNQLAVPDSSSSSKSLSPLWDVFLSFCGKDTRKSFVTDLYFALDQAGFLTFRDDPALQKGQEISLGLLKAIQHSKMFVVVLSENYARSSWCLDELVQIFNCKKTENQVIPVFYYVDPSDLRHQKGSFGEALEAHKKRHSVDIIEKWRCALADIAGISGYHLKKESDENESDTVQEIVENVVQHAPTKILFLEEYLFGIYSAVEEIYQKLSMELDDVRAIGICGMGGIGKTTIAKAFYNKYSGIFNVSCFIENSKQIPGEGSSPLLVLQKILIELLRKKDYKVSNAESGIEQLIHILCSKKALIVLDDLDESGHLEFLMRICNLNSVGSRIIITTRNVNLINKLKVDLSGVDLYMVKELGQKESLLLFSHHAFRKTTPPENFRKLSLKFVKYVGGLPLALKVLGSSLRGRTDVSFWKAQLERVGLNPEIHNILKLSYDELGYETEKNIFLDIVFFFIGRDKDEAMDVFKSCVFYPEAGIPILEERCLLTVDENNKFQMHNLIQDMGRKIILEECKRLYLGHENSLEALQNLKEMDKIEGLILDLTRSKRKDVNIKIFEKLPNLRLLEVVNGYIKGSSKKSFHELRCIRWPYCQSKHLRPSFCSQRLISIDMPFSELETLWSGTLPLVSLKTINVSYSKNLKAIPDLRDSNLIEKLLLGGCRSLVKVHSSVGHMTNLGHLDLHECEKLKELPESIVKLPILSHLNLSSCWNLKQLPKQLGDMKGLRILNASHTAIQELPDSIIHLTGLVELNLFCCTKLIRLPKQFGNMQGLREFHAGYSGIEQLPESFGQLINLVDLQLCSCESLISLPNSIWKLKFLQNLNLSGNSKLKRLPEQLGMMQSLRKLLAGNTPIEELPDSIGFLGRLQELDLYCSKKLKYVPNSIWNLTSLRSFNLLRDGRVIINLPDTVRNMKLTSLSLSCNIRLWLPVIQCFSSLTSLTLIDEGDTFSSTKPFSLSRLSNLYDLTVENCTSLGSFFPELPLNLMKLRLYNHALIQLLDLFSLKQLEELHIRRCTRLQSISLLPPTLEYLEVSECTSLQDELDLSMLKHLKQAELLRNGSNFKVNLKDSFLQVRDIPLLIADLPNTEVPEWFSHTAHGCTISFDVPPLLRKNCFGLVLWVVFKSKTTDTFSKIEAVLTNKKQGTKEKFRMNVHTNVVGELQSRVQCYRGGEHFLKSGDRIVVSFRRLLYSWTLEVSAKYAVRKTGLACITDLFDDTAAHVIWSHSNYWGLLLGGLIKARGVNFAHCYGSVIMRKWVYSPKQYS